MAPDLWHNLPAEEWQRLHLLHVPTKLTRREEHDTKAWLQYVEAKLAAKSRAAKEAPSAWVTELKEADLKHQQIYEAAARRISAILGDKEHFMHGKLEKVEPVPDVRPHKPKGRVDLFNQLVQQTPVDGQHKWQHQRSGVVCEYCGKRIKACSTHSEISQKQATACPGSVTKTLKQAMSELVQDTEGKLDEQPDHKWEIRTNNFGCIRCGPRSPLEVARQHWSS